MKALSVAQPWSELIALGEKTIEVRAWRTDYRGPLLIVATVSPKLRLIESLRRDGMRNEWPLGVHRCVVTLADVRPLTPDDGDDSFWPGELTPELCKGKYAWVFSRRWAVKATPQKGLLSLYDVSESLIVSSDALDYPAKPAPSRARGPSVAKTRIKTANR